MTPASASPARPRGVYLIAAMEAQGVPVPAQNRLLARLAPMRGEVIER